MSLETAFANLAKAFVEVRDAFVGLRLTAVEDRPEHHSVALVDWVADFVEDLSGAVQMGVGAVDQGRKAATVPRDFETAHRTLMECQQVRDLIRHRLSTKSGPQSRLRELKSFGQERGGEWRAWTEEVFGALERCRERLDGLVDPLFVCWQNLAEDLASPIVSVQTTSIGQQFTLPHEESVPK